MAINTQQAVEVPLSVFSGLVTEMSPDDLPGGVSPDCQDVVFVPGAVSSRPACQRIFATELGGGTSVMYAKSVVFPTGQIRNLYLNNLGAIYQEDPINAPGVATLLFQSTAGSRAKSVSAFGREYIAISDGLHGSDIPLQWDGVNLDRVTQDGPGAPATVTSLALPSVSMAAGSAPAAMTISSCQMIDYNGSYYTSFQVNITGGTIGGLAVGNQVVIAGNSQSYFNGTWTVTQLFTSTSFKVGPAYNTSSLTGTGGTATPTSGVTMTRANNQVTVGTASAHGLLVGYQAQITGIPAATVGGAITSISIDNEDAPGLATLVMSQPHGLVPGLLVTLNDVPGTPVGSGLASIFRSGGIVNATSNAAHGLAIGSQIVIAGVTGGTTDFNTAASVLSVPTTTTFTYAQNDVDDSSATVTGATITLSWPSLVADTPNYYEVQSAPTPNSFQISISYSDGTWTGGNVQYAWDGTFFVDAVPSATSFTYQQNGPNATSSTVGTVTPYGQASPGIHQLQVLFLTRQGYTTKPSPPVQFTANGGQYVAVSNIPIGPSNVVARILAFTGASGAYFYYIPTAAVVNGQQVSTATQINDNTTTAVTLDFSDNTLFAATAISIPGNNLSSQIVLDGALGFGAYDSRLITYGQRNRIQNFLNLGFDGGYLPSSPTVPTGWTPETLGGSADGSLVAGRFGGAYQINVTPSGVHGQIYQSAFEDAYGAPILTPNTQYTLRLWAQISSAAADVTLTIAFESVSTSTTIYVNIQGNQISTTGGWLQFNFSAKTPATIPADMSLVIDAQSTASTVTVTVDEISITYTENPYTDQLAYGSYINNPEGFDGLTGAFGAANDTRKLMDFGMVRDNLYLLTQEPSGRIHQTAANGSTEPSGWTVIEVGANCGLVSAFALAKSQADDGTASGGEEWLIWASSSGVRIFGGDQPWKISQEIQPDWDSINPAALGSIWALNDPVARVVYFGLPTGSHTSPNLIYPMNYRELDTPYQISTSAAVRTNFSGRLIATDSTRKWTRWNLAMNGAALMYRNASEATPVFFGGSFGNAYTLNASKYTDDDYGQIYPYYVTYYFVDHEAEVALQLGCHRKTLAYYQSAMLGVGQAVIQVYANASTNVWPFNCVRTLSLTPNFDLEWGGGSCTAQRMAFRIMSSPTSGTDNAFTLHKLIATLRPAARIPVRGSAQ